MIPQFEQFRDRNDLPLGTGALTFRERFQFGFDCGDLLLEGQRFFEIILLLLRSRELLTESLQVAVQNIDSFFAFLVHVILSWLRAVERKHGAADLLERQRAQIAGAGAERVDGVAVLGNQIVGLAMRDRGFDADH